MNSRSRFPANTITIEQMLPVGVIRKGEFCKRKPDSKTVYIRGDFDARSKSYSLTDVNDVNREVFVKKGTKLFIGFKF